MAQMPPLPQQPVAQDPSLTRSELMPFRSTKISIRRSRILVPLLALALTCVLLFVLKIGLKSLDDVVMYLNVLCAFMLFAMFAAIYFYSGERKNILWYLVPAIVVFAELAIRPILGTFIYVFRTILPGSTKGETFLPNFIGMFFGAGLMEELMKAVPILFALGLAYWLRATNSTGNVVTRNLALQGPLDGVLMGAAAGAGFIALETMFQYVPNAMREAGGGGNAALGALHGVLLMLPRVLNGLVGHMAYAGIFGYFIGLAVSHRRSLPTLLAVGWLLSATLHAFWNSGAYLIGTYAFYVSAGLTLFFFLACLLKAKQLEVSRLGGAIDGHSVLAVSPTPGTEPLAPAGVVPPPVPGVAGVFTGAASAAEHLAGVTARTTVPNPGAVPADAAPAAPPPPMPQSGLSIGDANARYALAANQAIDFSTLFGGVPAGCQGTIVAAGDGGLDIRNTGAAAWTWTTPDGATASVPPGGSIRPVAGGKLLLGSATIAVSAY
jgi:RsiW-degrading membrane proteinase PrsW (M82 family)